MIHMIILLKLKNFEASFYRNNYSKTYDAIAYRDKASIE